MQNAALHAEAVEREKEDAMAWASFLHSPAWPVVKRQLESVQRRYRQTTVTAGITADDRAVCCGVLYVLDLVLRSPEDALRVLAREPLPRAAGDLQRPALSVTNGPGIAG